MKKYIYVAKNLEGKKIKGTFIAENEDFVKKSLAKQNLFVTKIRNYSNQTPASFFSVSERVGIKELTSFCEQFSVLISAGISIIESIKTLQEQPFSSLLKKTLGKVVDDLYEGLMLSEAMKKYPKIFPEFFTSMVYVGESSGKLDKVLNSVAEYYTREKKNKSKMRSALAYPTILFVMMIAVLIIMLHVVIPTFISSFSQMEIEMPALTMFLFNASLFFRENWQYLALGLIIIIFSIYLFKKSKSGKYFFDMLKVKLPIASKINMAVFTSKFVQCLGLLLSSGLDIVSALESIEATVDNVYLNKQFKQVILDVKKGISLSNAIEIEMRLSKVVTQMIGVGEKTGQTDKMLLQTSDFFDQEVEKSLGLISTIIQPTLLALLGGVIALMFVAMYSPILSMITSLNA